MSQSVIGVRLALRAVIQAQYPNAATGLGDPGQYQPGEIVTLMQVRMPVTLPVAATTRPREITSEHDVVFSVYRPGGPEAQEACDTQALAMVATLEDYFRTKPNETLPTAAAPSGTCREALITNTVLDTFISWEEQAPGDFVAAGRNTTATVTVTARVRRDQ